MNKPIVKRVDRIDREQAAIAIEKLLEFFGLSLESVDARNGYPPAYRIVKDGSPQG